MYHEVTPTPVERYRKYAVTPAETILATHHFNLTIHFLVTD